MHERTISFEPASTVERRAVATATDVPYDDAGLAAVFQASTRPRWEFSVRLEPMTAVEARSLSALHAFHQGAKPFLWDGGPWGTVTTLQTFSEGDGTGRVHRLPNRNIGVGSLAVRTLNRSTAATSDWAANSSNGWPYSLSATAGVVTFANSSNTVPATGTDVQARYGCQYRVFFPPDGLVLRKPRPNLYTAEFDLVEATFL